MKICHQAKDLQNSTNMLFSNQARTNKRIRMLFDWVSSTFLNFSKLAFPKFKSPIGVVWLCHCVNNVNTGTDEYRLNFTIKGL